MALTRWKYVVQDKQVIARLAKDLSLSSLAIAALASKGITETSDAVSFINNERTLPSPFDMKDMDIAVERIHQAIDDNECIVVFGDYDVDGIMSSVMVYQYLESIGADVRVLIPERDNSGYGLAVSSVEQIIELEATLIITVDNGVSSFEAVDYAKKFGIDTIICDHHIVPKTLPNAIAVVDPLREDDSSSFKKLAGVGVALNLISALEGCTVEEMMELFGDLAAIGTIADVVPLIEDNRYILWLGMEYVRTTSNMGLAALVEQTSLSLETLSVQDITYTIVPRINAAGRMASAEIALNLLILENYNEVTAIAKELCELNTMRQKIEAGMYEIICNDIDNNLDFWYEPIIIVAAEEYSSGVSGIVCSKLSDRYMKPAIVISIEGTIAKGSARSVEGFSLYDAIDAAKDCLITYGGHDMAAGFTLSVESITAFKSCIMDYCRQLTELRIYRSIYICDEIDFSVITEANVADLEKLAPFGASNEEPIFSTCSATIKEISALAQNHSRITFEKNNRSIRCALFQTTPDQLGFNLGEVVDIAYPLSLYNASNGLTYVSIRLKGIVPAGYSNEDYESVSNLETLCYGRQLDESKLHEIHLTRQDVATAYRSIKTKPLIDTKEQIVFRFSSILTPARSIAAVLVLKELSLVEIVTLNNVKTITVKPDSIKKELSDSRIFRLLAKDE